MDATKLKQDIEELNDMIPSHLPVVSIYMPTHVVSRPQNVQADKTRLHNAVHDMLAQLEKLEVRKPERELYAKQIEPYFNDNDFWQHLEHGLAMFVMPDDIRYYRLPVEVDELTHTGEEFVFTPLIAATSMSQKFDVLHVNLKEPMLFRASISGLEKAEDVELPGEMREALRIADYEQEQQFHSVGSSGNQAQYHGHGAAKDNSDSEVINYMRLIAQSLEDVLDKQTPLLMVGTTDHVAEFKKVFRHPKLIDDYIEGNFERDFQELENRVMSYMEDNLLFNSEDEAKRLTVEQAATDKKSFAALDQAAEDGRVSELFINIFKKSRDSVDESMKESFRLELNMDMPQLEALERIVQNVISNGGTIIGRLLKDEKHKLSASLRY